MAYRCQRVTILVQGWLITSVIPTNPPAPHRVWRPYSSLGGPTSARILTVIATLGRAKLPIVTSVGSQFPVAYGFQSTPKYRGHGTIARAMTSRKATGVKMLMTSNTPQAQQQCGNHQHCHERIACNRWNTELLLEQRPGTGNHNHAHTKEDEGQQNIDDGAQILPADMVNQGLMRPGLDPFAQYHQVVAQQRIKDHCDDGAQNTPPAVPGKKLQDLLARAYPAPIMVRRMPRRCSVLSYDALSWSLWLQLHQLSLQWYLYVIARFSFLQDLPAHRLVVPRLTPQQVLV